MLPGLKMRHRVNDRKGLCKISTGPEAVNKAKQVCILFACLCDALDYISYYVILFNHSIVHFRYLSYFCTVIPAL